MLEVLLQFDLSPESEEDAREARILNDGSAEVLFGDKWSRIECEFAAQFPTALSAARAEGKAEEAGWISVEERAVPQDGLPKFISDSDGLGIAIPDGKGGYTALTVFPYEDTVKLTDTGVTHWQPLPSPPGGRVICSLAGVQLVEPGGQLEP